MPSVYKWGSDFERAPGWTILKAAVFVFVIITLIITGIIGLVTTGSVFFQGAAAKITNPARVEQKVYDPNNTIAQIAFFHDRCNTARAQLRIVKNNQARYDADLRAAHFAKDPVRQQQAQDQLSADETDVAGAMNVLQATVADYNSRSAQSTANVFKGNNLPERINLPDPIPAGYTIDCG